MGDMAEYYDDREDGSKEELQRLFGMGAAWQHKYVYQETPHLIYQNKLMDQGLTLEQRSDMAYEQYIKNGNMKVKQTCVCPSCGVEFIKGSYQQRFCKVKLKMQSSCKDFFHNFVNVKRREKAKEYA